MMNYFSFRFRCISLVFLKTLSARKTSGKKMPFAFFQSLALSHAHREQRNALKLNLSYPQRKGNSRWEKSTSIHMTTRRQKQYDRRKPQAVNKKWESEWRNKWRKNAKAKRARESEKQKKGKETTKTAARRREPRWYRRKGFRNAMRKKPFLQ